MFLTRTKKVFVLPDRIRILIIRGLRNQHLRGRVGIWYVVVYLYQYVGIHSIQTGEDPTQFGKSSESSLLGYKYTSHTCTTVPVRYVRSGISNESSLFNLDDGAR